MPTTEYISDSKNLGLLHVPGVVKNNLGMPDFGCVGRSQRVEVLVALEVPVPDPGVHPLEAEPISGTKDRDRQNPGWARK